MQLLLSGIINCTQLVGVVTSLWTMDRFGRRPLLLIGAAMMFISHLIIAVLVGKFGDVWSTHATEGWVAVAFLFFYMFSFGATWGPVPWAMPSEIFPSSLRAKGVALSTCSNWFNNFVIVSIYLPPPAATNILLLTNGRDWSLLHWCRIPASARTLSSPSSAFSRSFSRSSWSRRQPEKASRLWMRSSRMSAARLRRRGKRALSGRSWRNLRAMAYQVHKSGIKMEARRLCRSIL